jgi:uncharacterized cofD-like protein
MGVKRWLLVMVAGSVVMGMGFVYLMVIAFRSGLLPTTVFNHLMLGFMPIPWRIILPLLLGFLLIVVATVRLGANLVEPFRRPGDSLAASLYFHSRRGRGPQIVAVGGGTGLPNLLRGLKEFTSNITAVVTVADDGGSSGRLRQELGVLPPGDFRNNLAALSDDEALMTQVLQYRFGAGVGQNGQGELRGHAFGNLLLAALAGITGSFDEALLAAERVLAIRGRVLPSTLEQVSLVADVEIDGATSTRKTHRVVGESAIPESGGRIRRVYLEPANIRAYPAAIQAILQADLVVLGPGSLFTSILPNLLVPGVAQALCHTGAQTVYVCNLATQPGETNSFTVSDHVDTLTTYVGEECLDVVVANNNLILPVETAGNTRLVEPIWPPSRRGHMRLVLADLLDEKRPWQHDSVKLAAVLKKIEETEKTGQTSRL